MTLFAFSFRGGGGGSGSGSSGSASSFSQFDQAINRLKLGEMGDSATLEQSAGNIDEQVSGVVEQAKELQDAASSHISRTSVEEQALRKSALSLDSNIHRLRSLIDSLHRNKILDPKLADKVAPFFCLSDFA